MKLVIIIIAVAACTGAPDYKCQSNVQCVDGKGASGVCESNGYCSFADTACAGTERRYSAGAGDQANACVAAAATGCISDLVGGDQHFCAVRSDGTVWCWGANDAGQLGDGTTMDRAAPVQVKTPAGKKFVEVRATENSSCALATDDTVWCWGTNDTGQLGVASAGVPHADSSTPIQVTKTDSGATFLAKHLSAGGKHVCGVDGNGALYCWGENSDGQCGEQPPSAGGSADDVFVPTPVAGLAEGMVAVSVGDEHSAALKDDGSVWEFGGNANGQLGDGTTTDSWMPVQARITSVKTIAGGDEHICGSKNDGTIWCWGYGVALGLAGGMDQTTPQRTLTAESVWAGGSAFHACAVQGEALMCWGQNDKGQIGTGAIDPDNATLFTPVAALLATVERAAGATGDTCAVTVDGELWCWGANDRGQLAQGAIGEPMAVPQRVAFACP